MTALRRPRILVASPKENWALHCEVADGLSRLGYRLAGYKMIPPTRSEYYEAAIAYMLEADALVLVDFNEYVNPFEDLLYGLAVGLGRRVVTVGPFKRAYPNVDHYYTWDEAYAAVFRHVDDFAKRSYTKRKRK